MEEKLRIIRDILGGYRQSSNEFLFQCPYCGHHKKKMSVNFSLNAFKCWICDQRGKNIYRMVRKFGNYKQRQQYLELIGRLDLSEFDKILNEINDVEEKQVIDLPEEFVSLCNKHLPLQSKRALDYLRGRGIGKSEILKYKELNLENAQINNVVNKIIQNLNFSSQSQFENYLSDFDFSINDLKKKIEIENEWKNLVYLLFQQIRLVYICFL